MFVVFCAVRHEFEGCFEVVEECVDICVKKGALVSEVSEAGKGGGDGPASKIVTWFSSLE